MSDIPTDLAPKKRGRAKPAGGNAELERLQKIVDVLTRRTQFQLEVNNIFIEKLKVLPVTAPVIWPPGFAEKAAEQRKEMEALGLYDALRPSITLPAGTVMAPRPDGSPAAGAPLPPSGPIPGAPLNPGTALAGGGPAAAALPPQQGSVLPGTIPQPVNAVPPRIVAAM